MNTKLFSILILIFAVACFTGCKEDACEEMMIECGPNGICLGGFCECEEGWKGSACDQKVETNESLSGILTADKTLEGDQVYEIRGKYVVNNGATLTIKPGAILKFAEGDGTNASALVIARGSKIDAVGTAEKPIILTSVLDNIVPGQITGSNLKKIDSGLWGGLVVLGNAKISANQGDTQAGVEGLTETEDYALFGGDQDDDDSGKIKYVSVRHAGTEVAPGKEINGITLGGVGNQTEIENVEVVANSDDGIEFFGGTVDVKNAIVVYQGDDAIDIDQNYSGTIDNFYVRHGATPKSNHALEIDGPENDTYTDGKFSLKNGTCLNDDGQAAGAAWFKSKAQGSIENVSFEGYTANIELRASFDPESMDDIATRICNTKTDALSNFMDGELTFKNCELVNGEASLADFVYGEVDEDDYRTVGEGSNQTNYLCAYGEEDEKKVDELFASHGNVVNDSRTKGANLEAFKDWTWTDANGELR